MDLHDSADISQAQPLDVLIIGAGMAGIGVARELQVKHPGRNYVIVDMRERIGGTWDFFKYPGLRSDVDMHLYGFSWKPWTGPTGVASAENILSYLNEAADEEGITDHIHFGWKMVAADFDTSRALWTVRFDGQGEHAGKEYFASARWLQYCGGYYSYESGYRPEFPNESIFHGEIIHPQDWPEGKDVTGKHIVVIGSGATAVTLIPELAKSAAHVTMLQRSPTYIFAGPREPRLTRWLRRALPQPRAYSTIRAKDLWIDNKRHQMTTEQPEKIKAMIRKNALRHLPRNFPYDDHFVPRYEPSEQRVCFAPDGDIFHAIADGRASVVTDTIDSFTGDGILTQSGDLLEADLVITATGLRMVTFGGNKISVDGRAYHVPDEFIYRGIMFSGLPNLAITIGSLVHSYTLRVELIAQWVCRVLAHMDSTGTNVATPTLPKPHDEMIKRPFTEDFTSGYVRRGLALNASQSDADPWVNQQAYKDSLRIYNEALEDGALQFSDPSIDDMVA